MRRTLAAGALILGLILTGCSSTGSSAPASGDTGTGDGYGYDAPSSEASQSAASESGLKIADTSLGAVVVDGDGMTAYMYDKDTQGAATSACTGACLTQWPPILSASAEPKAEGVTGRLATIDTPDGEHQVTLDGRPLYTFAGDAAPGDVTGQGVGGIWWVVSSAGEKIGG